MCGGSVATRRERVYVDSCVFVNVFTGGVGDRNEEQWLRHGLWLLEEGQAGGIALVVSPLTVAESSDRAGSEAPIWPGPSVINGCQRSDRTSQTTS